MYVCMYVCMYVNISKHITYIYKLISGAESCFCTLYTCLVLQQRHIQNPFKHLRRSVFACPVNDFKPLTVYAKKAPS